MHKITVIIELKLDMQIWQLHYFNSCFAVEAHTKQTNLVHISEWNEHQNEISIFFNQRNDLGLIMQISFSLEGR